MTRAHGQVATAADERTGRDAERRSRRRTGRHLRGFSRNQSGATAVEFAILAMPFLLFVFSILEMSLAFFAERVLQDGLMAAKRQVRLGNITTAGDFQRHMCQTAAVSVLLDCSAIRISMERVPDGGRPPEPPRDADGNVDYSRLAFNVGPRSSTHITRAFYDWPRFLPVGMTSSGAYVSTAKFTTIQAVGVFHREP